MVLINGKKLAEKIKKEIKQKTALMRKKPGLAVILIGNDLSSAIYIKAKEKACREVGFYFRKTTFPKNISQEKVIKEIKKLNQDQKINAILVQLPLPKHFNKKAIINSINPQKDVDCFHPLNVNKLALLKDKKKKRKQLLAPCTAKGVIRLIKSTGIDIKGKKVVVVGRSELVGKPTALLLRSQGAKVIVCHSQTRNLSKETKKGDILVSAVGKASLITKNMVKKGAIVIDVGINQTKKGITGDVDFNQVKQIASYITPVPGGVGPMTIAGVLENTLLLSKK